MVSCSMSMFHGSGFPPGWRRCVVFYLAGCLGISISTAASAAEQEAKGSGGFISFDIPAEPLDEALFAYTGITGLGVLVEDGVASGRRSSAVRGRFTPEVALTTLLAGTDLEFRYTISNAFTLIPVQVAAIAAPPRVADVLRNRDGEEAYFRVVQNAVKHALCSRAQTLPGQYRVAVQLWIGASGLVLRSAFLGSTGSRDRDERISAMLDGLAIGENPPTGLLQPVTLVVLPRSPDTTGDCVPADPLAQTKARG